MIELGQVKKEALRLMFVSYDEDLDSYEDMYDNSNYISYLLGMPGAINRCFDRIKSARKQPKRVIDLTSYVVDYDEYAMTNQYNLNSISIMIHLIGLSLSQVKVLIMAMQTINSMVACSSLITGMAPIVSLITLNYQPSPKIPVIARCYPHLVSRMRLLGCFHTSLRQNSMKKINQTLQLKHVDSLK